MENSKEYGDAGIDHKVGRGGGDRTLDFLLPKQTR